MTREANRPAGPVVSTGVLVGGLGIVQIVGWGILVHMFSAFIKPMQDEFGWTSAEVTGALALGLFIGDIVSIPVGQWIDRRGGYGIMTLGAIFGAILVALWSQIDALWQLYAIWGLMGVAIGMGLNNNCSAVITANVPDYRSGLAYMAFLSGLASSIGIPVASLLATRYGWREALVIAAFIQFFGAACVCAYVLRGVVGGGHTARDTTASVSHSSLRVAVRTRVFWFLALACATHWFINSCINVHLLPLLQERGLTLDAALTIVALMGPVAVMGRIVLFYGRLNTSARRTGRIVFPLLVVSLLILLLSAQVGYWGLIVFAILYGLSNGVLVIVRQTAIAEMFGIRAFGAISGAITTVGIIPRTGSPLAVSAMRDYFGSYDAVVWTLILVMLVSTALFYAAAAQKSVAT